MNPILSIGFPSDQICDFARPRLKALSKIMARPYQQDNDYGLAMVAAMNLSFLTRLAYELVISSFL